MTTAEARQQCVAAFPLSNTRADIMAGLESVIHRLDSVLLAGELWLDGSFLTSKINPNDVDILLRVQAHLYDNGTPQQRATIDWLRGNLKDSHRCDSYVLMEYPGDHGQFATGEWMRAYWTRQYGFSRTNEMKGIAVILLPHAAS